MATNIIKIKRTTGTTAPSSLNAGELAFSGGAGTQGNNGQRLFIGDPANSNAVTVIGGNYFSNLMDHAHGTTTAASALIVDTNKSTTELRTPALYIGTSGSDTLVSSTAAELNLIDGSSAGTIVNSKALIYGAQGQVNATTLQLAGTSITASAAELNVLDGFGGSTADLNIINGVTSTTAELNIVDGNTSATSTTVADADRLVLNDNGTMVQVAVTDLAAYLDDEITAMPNLTSFGTLSSLTVDDVNLNGKVVTMTGSSGDTATITVGTNGTLDITTVDTAAAAANIQITADGTAELAGTTVTLDASAGLTLDAGSGTITFADDGSSLGTITASGWSGNTATFTASANNSTDETVYPVFVDGATGAQGAETDTGLSYNPSTGLFTTVGLDISGDIDVDGTTNLDNTDIDGTLTVDGAIDLNATTLDIDATDDIDIDTSDTTGGIAIGTANSGVPITIGHGTSEVTVGDNLTVTGDFQVNGTTTTVNSTTVNIADPVFEIGDSSSDDNLDRGIKMKYNSSGAKIAFMGWDDSSGHFVMLHNATDSSSTFTGTKSTLDANIEVASGGSGLKIGDSYPFSDSSGTLTLTNIDGIDATTEATLESAIDTLSNLTSVGTIGTGVWNGTAIAIGSGGTGLSAAGTSGFIPVSNGSAWVMQAIDGGTYS